MTGAVKSHTFSKCGQEVTVFCPLHSCCSLLQHAVWIVASCSAGLPHSACSCGGLCHSSITEIQYIAYIPQVADVVEDASFHDVSTTKPLSTYLCNAATANFAALFYILHGSGAFCASHIFITAVTMYVGRSQTNVS